MGSNGAKVPADTAEVSAKRASAASVIPATPSIMVSYSNGAKVPADTAEVSAAKAAHLATKNTIAVSPISVIAKPAYYIASRMVSHANGAVVPADEPAVYAAKVKHYKAMAM